MELNRRNFLKSAAVATGAAAVAGTAAVAHADEAPVAWDYETDFVVVGTGTAFIAPFMLEKIGANYLIVEARGVFGGTMALSGCGCWVPRNHLMDEEGFVDLSLEELNQYVHECDLFGNVDDALLPDYLVNAPVAFKYFADELDIFTCYSNIPDYYNNEKGEFTGRRKLNFSAAHADPAIQGLSYFPQVIQPRIEDPLYDQHILYNTTGKKLVTDEAGAVIGITCETADGDINIKAAKGVLLATGGFDWNPKMRKEFLRFPIFGTNNVHNNNGSGHRMAQEVGADFGNMGSVWGLPFFAGQEFDINQLDEVVNTNWDWFYWRGQPHSIIVNKDGKRFTNEQASYPSTYFNYFEYDIRTSVWRNLPATFIFDNNYATKVGWPQSTPEQPEWVKGPYNTLEELAADWGIDPAGLAAEVEVFNGYCAAGEDPQFARGLWPWDNWCGSLWGDAFADLPNNSLGPIEQAPFYACQIVPGCCGTCGGPKINPDAQILDIDGNPIPGLYGAGNLVANVFGSGYPGSGGTEGPGCYYTFRAIHHAYGLGLTKEV